VGLISRSKKGVIVWVGNVARRDAVLYSALEVLGTVTTIEKSMVLLRLIAMLLVRMDTLGGRHGFSTNGRYISLGN